MSTRVLTTETAAVEVNDRLVEPLRVSLIDRAVVKDSDLYMRAWVMLFFI